MLRILFILENLGGGGAERVLPNLLKYLNPDKFSVTVLTLFADGINRQRLSANVTYLCRQALHFRGMTHAIKFIPPTLLFDHYVKKAVCPDDFDILVAYMSGLPTKILAGANNKKKIAWIHGDIMAGYTPNLPKNFLSLDSMRHHLNQIDAFVGVSQVVCDSFKQYTGIAKNVHLIHNTNDIEEIRGKAAAFNPFEQRQNRVQIVSVGHLAKVKGNERLLRVAQRLKKDGFGFCMTILGEGNERSKLEAYINEYALGEEVKLPGFVDNPYPYVKNADLYVCSSLSEGFSTAVSEAVILGIPVISTRVSGAEEILGTSNEYGIVCDNNEEGLYQALKKMLENDELRRCYAQKASQRAHFFEPLRTVGEVEELFEQVMKIQADESEI